MQPDVIEEIGRQLFSVLVALLRPALRREDGGTPGRLRQPAPAPPQSGDLTAELCGRLLTVDVAQRFEPCADPPRSLSCVFPLPPGAVVRRVHLMGTAAAEAEVCERATALERFRRALGERQPAVRVSEDVPGIVTQEITGMSESDPCGCALRYSADLTVPGSDIPRPRLRLMVHFDSAGPEPRAGGARPLVRLGSSRILDGVLGMQRRSPSRRDFAHLSLSQLFPESDAADVLVSCERDDGAGAVFRGTIAERSVRIVAQLRRWPDAASRHDVAEEDGVASLMRVYRRPGTTEPERRRLAQTISQLGWRHSVVTPWTALVAVAAPPRDPAGRAAAAVA